MRASAGGLLPVLGIGIFRPVNVVSRRTLVTFWTAQPAARKPLEACFAAARAAEWSSPGDIREAFASADFLGDNRVIFNIGGNNFRLVVRISYRFKQVMIKFVGSHAEYDQIDAETA